MEPVEDQIQPSTFNPMTGQRLKFSTKNWDKPLLWKMWQHLQELNASFSIYILNSSIKGNEKKQVKLERKMGLGIIGARVYLPKSILPISLDPRKSHDPQKSILPISLTKIYNPFTLQKSLLTKQRKKKKEKSYPTHKT